MEICTAGSSERVNTSSASLGRVAQCGWPHVTCCCTCVAITWARLRTVSIVSGLPLPLPRPTSAAPSLSRLEINSWVVIKLHHPYILECNVLCCFIRILWCTSQSLTTTTMLVKLDRCRSQLWISCLSSKKNGGHAFTSTSMTLWY